MGNVYRRIRFDCPGCGIALMVDAAQVRRQEVVTCSGCNTDLRLVPRGTASATVLDRDGAQAVPRRPRDAVVVPLG